jgi:hypothetical protein
MNTTIIIVVVGVAVIYLLSQGSQQNQSSPGILQQGASDLAEGFGFMSGSG